MSLPNNYYVAVNLSAGGWSVSDVRQPIGRWFTTNSLLPFGQVMQFTSLSSVVSYFGANSQEARRATSYFGFVSKDRKSPKLISFARYTPEGTAVGASVISGTNTFYVDNFNALSGEEGGIIPTIEISYTDEQGNVHNSSVDVHVSTELTPTLTDVASAMQTALQGSGDEIIKTATVEYETAMNGSRFVLTIPAGYGTINSVSGSIAEVASWQPTVGIYSAGANGLDTIVEQLQEIMRENDNCYTFAFIEQLDDATKEAISLWNASLNGDFVYCVPYFSLAEITTNIGAMDNNFTWIQFDNTNENQEFMPMAAEATVDYSKPNANINFMFQRFPNNSFAVKDLTIATALDVNNVNYYAETQQAGVKRGWLQRGKCQGQLVDASVAFGAIWIKAEVIRKVKELFDLNNAIPVNKDGIAKIKACLNSVWSQGITNGCILKDKVLSDSERVFIYSITQDENTWLQIQQTGIWFDCSIEQSTNPETLGEKYFTFTLLYGAPDQIRKIEGNQIAITSAQ